MRSANRSWFIVWLWPGRDVWWVILTIVQLDSYATSHHRVWLDRICLKRTPVYVPPSAANAADMRLSSWSNLLPRLRSPAHGLVHNSYLWGIFWISNQLRTDTLLHLYPDTSFGRLLMLRRHAFSSFCRWQDLKTGWPYGTTYCTVIKTYIRIHDFEHFLYFLIMQSYFIFWFICKKLTNRRHSTNLCKLYKLHKT